MDAKDHPVIAVLGDQRRFVVPIFQRQYTWGKDRLLPFWEDVVAKAEEALQGKPKFSHYMGALILAPGGDGFTIGVTPRVQVIDGQQRLTTFQLFLAALKEVAQGVEAHDIPPLVDGYLHIPRMSGDTGPDATFRLVPTPEDRPLFQLIVIKGLAGLREKHPEWFYKNGKLADDKTPKAAARAFAFLTACIDRYARFGAIDEEHEGIAAAADEPQTLPSHRLKALMQALLNHLKLVVITLGEDDDAQVIFETLNSKAEPLLAMDLVRNNIFHRATTQGESVENLFTSKWRQFDVDATFWKADSPRAKPRRPRIDHFLSHALTAQTGEETSLRELYAEYRAFVRPKGKPRFASVEDELQALVDFAPIYRALEEGSGQDDLASIGRRLNLWEVSTAYPLVFRIAASSADLEEKNRLYTLVYSYLVRRAVCGLTPKSLNKTFARITRRFLEHGVSTAVFGGAFAEQRGDAVRFPGDAELKQAILTKPIYHLFARKDRLAELLWDLEIATRTRFNVNTPRPFSMSIEHVMPQAWPEHWPLNDGKHAPADKITGAQPDMLNEIQAREGALHTLGNLTLVTVPANTLASNSAFSQKKQWLMKSLLALNLELIEAGSWDVHKIRARAESLAQRAAATWPAPPAS